MNNVNGRWDLFELRDLILRKFTGPSPTCEERPIASDEEWGILKTTAITWDGWNERAHKVPPREYWGNSSIEVQPGDVLITKAGPRHRVGVPAYVADTIPRLMVSGKMIGLRPDRRRVHPRLLSDLLASRPVQEYLNSRTTGMAESQTNFSDASLLAAHLRVPPMDEQRRIVNILDTLDEQIRLTRNMISKLGLAREGVVNDLVSRGEANAFLSNAATKITDGTHQAVKLEESGEIPFLYVSCVRRGQVNWAGAGRISDVTYKAISPGREPRAGMVLYTAVGSYGHAASVEQDVQFSFQRHIACIYPDSKEARGEYLALYLNSDKGRRQSDSLAVGNAQKTVTLGSLSSFTIWLPSLDEQLRIMETVQGFDRLIEAERANLSKTLAVRSGLISDLLTGQVRLPQEASP